MNIQVVAAGHAVEANGSTIAVSACTVLIEIFAAYVAVIRWAIAGMQRIAAVASVHHAPATCRTKVFDRVIFELAAFHALNGE